MARSTPAISAAAVAALSFGAAGAWGQAQPPDRSVAAGGDPVVAVVEGLSPGDLLNIRALASPTAPVILRLANGSAVNRYDCGMVDGYRWCKVAAVEKPALLGWTPARYLLYPASVTAAEMASGVPAEPGSSPVAGAPDETGASAQSGRAVLADLPPGLPELSEPGPELAVTPQPPTGPAAEASRAPAADPGGDGGQPATEGDPLLAFVAQQEFAANRAEAALGLAFAAPDPLLGAIYTPDGERPAAPPAGPAADLTGSLPAPQPTPARTLQREPAPATVRPDSASEGSPEAELAPAGSAQASSGGALPSGELLAQADTPAADPAAGGSPADVAGEIPCARYIGQPMTRCRVRVAQAGKAAADVAVLWPDGGERVIRFRNGQPEGSNSRGEFGVTREGGLNLIRIGVSERFEILDAVPFGE